METIVGLQVRNIIRKVHRGVPINGILTLACGTNDMVHSTTKIVNLGTTYEVSPTKICGNCWRSKKVVLRV